MQLEQELRTLLREDAPTEAQCDAWVHDALEARPRRTPVRMGRWLMAAAAAIVVVALTTRRDAHTPVQGEGRDGIAEQRAANHAALKAVEDDRWKKAKGQYALVARGEVAITAKLDFLEAWSAFQDPKAKHRFFFRIEHTPPYDVVADRSPVAERIAGLGFLDPTGIKLSGKPGAWTLRRGKHVLKLNSKEPTINLDFGGRRRTFRIERESLCPIMLPAGVEFPRAEIPGTAIYEGMDRKWRSYRRYFVRVRHASLGLDMWLEADGARHEGAVAPGNIFGVRLGGHVFQALHGDPALRAQREKRPLLVLHLNDKDTEKLNTLFEALDLDGYSQCFVPQAKGSSLRHYTKDGTLVGILQLPMKIEDARGYLRGSQK